MGKLLLGDSSMINNNLKYCREELEMTQQELGYVFGVSKNTGTDTFIGNVEMPCNVPAFLLASMAALASTYLGGIPNANRTFLRHMFGVVPILDKSNGTICFQAILYSFP